MVRFSGISLSFVLALVAGCHEGVSKPAADSQRPAPPTASTPSHSGNPATAEKPASPSFVDRVWRVEKSSAVAPGTLYTFQSDGTLLMSLPGSKPMKGKWSRSGAGLIMVEDSLSYQVDILALTDTSFAIRSHNPGEPVDIFLVPAGEVARDRR